MLSTMFLFLAVHMFLGDPQHHGVAAGEGPHGRPHVVWRAQTDGPVRSSPAIDGDAVFVGSEDGYLYAFDRVNGRTLWRFRT
jgi:PQQ-like domain